MVKMTRISQDTIQIQDTNRSEVLGSFQNIFLMNGRERTEEEECRRKKGFPYEHSYSRAEQRVMQKDAQDEF